MTKFSRFCLWLTCICSVMLMGILSLMMFAHNVEPESHVPLSIVACLVVQNIITLGVTARFLYFQDEHFKVINALYPILARIDQVTNGGK